MTNLNMEQLFMLVANLVAIGVFIGVNKSTLKQIKDELQHIKETLNTHTEEISSLRERVAVVEEKLKH